MIKLFILMLSSSQLHFTTPILILLHLNVICSPCSFTLFWNEIQWCSPLKKWRFLIYTGEKIPNLYVALSFVFAPYHSGFFLIHFLYDLFYVDSTLFCSLHVLFLLKISVSFALSFRSLNHMGLLSVNTSCCICYFYIWSLASIN